MRNPVIAFLAATFAVSGCGDSSSDENREKRGPNQMSDNGDDPRHLAELTSSLGADLVYVRSGTFSMGSPTDETRRDRDELRHRVTLSRGFYVWPTEVTQVQWKKVMGTKPWVGGPYFREGDNHPAGAMSWEEAKAFCTKLTALDREAGRLPEGFEYRLPTEAEWEYACRAGSDTAYFFGDDREELHEYARFNHNAEGSGPLEVATRKPNAWGLYDMHGNVWEWCLDRAEWEVGEGAIRHLVNDSYRDGVTDPYSEVGAAYVYRGGAWLTPGYECRSANRSSGDHEGGWPDAGFRPILAPTPEG